MIRGNLATRPFYNERLIHRWLAVLTLLALALTIYNVTQVLYYSRSDTDLKARADADDARAAELVAAATALQQGQDDSQSRLTSVAALEANQLIALRTFSWSALLNHFEAALPPDVRITAVRPAAQTGRRRTIVMTVVGRSVDAIDAFMQNLEDTGAFVDALSRDEQVNDADEIEAAIEAAYAPAAPTEAAP